MYKTEEHKYGNYSIVKIEGDRMQIEVSNDILSFLCKCNLSGKNVIDGGSNIGLFSLVLSDLVGLANVYAFELQRIIFQIGCANAVLNGKTNIISFNNPLSDVSGRFVGFTGINYHADYLSSVGVKTESQLGSMDYYDRAKTIALDDLNIENVGLVKLDLEGHEPKALEGMRRTIDKYKPFLLIEISAGYLEERGVKELIEKINSHGYIQTELSDHNFAFEPI